MKNSITSFSLEEIRALTKELGQPSFRSKQLIEWLYKHYANSYDEMTNLPKSFREKLAREYPFTRPFIVDKQVSSDGTVKYVLEYPDGAKVETVGIPSTSGKDRFTVCFSTQAGCPMGCTFCATGKEGLLRNLTCGEIAEQLLLVARDCNVSITNAVGMGQGEPFLNYESSRNALKILNNPDCLGIGARHITISTCGIIPGIENFSNEPEQITLAVSLHSAIQQTRDELMPKVQKYPLAALKKTLLEYVSMTNRRITLEYIMIDGVNDSQEHLEALIAFCKSLLCHVNFIPINNIEGSRFHPSSSKTMQFWVNTLQAKGTEATVRYSRGSDIAGACGQLKNKFSAF